MRRATLGVVGVLVVAVAAGCGGGGGGGGGERLTKEKYIAAADAICKEANDQIDALGEPQSVDELVSLADKAKEIGTTQLEKLRALSPPAADEEQLNGAYDLIEQQLGKADEIVQAAKDGDLDKVQQIVGENDALNEQADQIAIEYGLTECGTN